jgi:hypothetical protein
MFNFFFLLDDVRQDIASRQKVNKRAVSAGGRALSAGIKRPIQKPVTTYTNNI